MPHYAKVFQSGNSQAVRLPKEFRLTANRVEVSREGDAIILRPQAEETSRWARLTSALERGVSADFMQQEREQPPVQERAGLDDTFG